MEIILLGSLGRLVKVHACSRFTICCGNYTCCVYFWVFQKCLINSETYVNLTVNCYDVIVITMLKSIILLEFYYYITSLALSFALKSMRIVPYSRFISQEKILANGWH